MTIDVKFNDSGESAKCPPNPKYPNGMTVSIAKSGQRSCTFNLPKAPRVGSLSVVCRDCLFTALVTVAGRADDPCVLTMPCKVQS